MAAKGRNTGDRAVVALFANKIRRALKAGDCAAAATAAHDLVTDAVAYTPRFFDYRVAGPTFETVRSLDARVKKACGVDAYRAALAGRR